MADAETTFLNDPESYLAISSPDHLLEEYPNQFVKTELEGNPVITFELSGKNRENNERERVFCTKTHIGLIESDEKYNIWDLDMTDQKILSSIFQKMNGLAIRYEKENKKATEEIIIPDYNRLVKVTYLPKTVESSEYIKNMLNRRREFLQK